MFFSKEVHELVLCWSNKTICSLINLVKMRKQVPQIKQLFKDSMETLANLMNSKNKSRNCNILVGLFT